ncbi:SlyX family protein [Arsukibacterium sp.]|uniref:SlyX family protein n=1 Tax=Arsukibacterium sp. TaxID=1977258 RepID=UPI002FDB4205
MSDIPEEIQMHLIDLESKIAFQEDNIQSLNDELHQHQRRIELLQRQVQMLAEKLHQLPDDSGILRTDEEPPPPHY